MREPREPRCPMCRAGTHDDPWHCTEHRTMHGTCHKHGGQPCHGQLRGGLRTCRMHSGDPRTAKVRVLAAQITPRLGEPHWQPIEIHPAEALLQEVWYYTGLCAWLDQIVNGLQRGEMVWGLSRHVAQRDGGEDGGPTLTVESRAGLNTWIEWQERSHREKARVARMALEGEAEERMLRLAEAQGARAFAAYQAGLEAIVPALTGEQWASAREGFPAVLAKLAA
jgi:hypothetical protein